MSRSYKKSPALSGMNYKDAKRRANKKVRRVLKDPEFSVNGKAYKRFYQSWDIRDYREFAPSFEVFCERELEKERRRRIWGFSSWLYPLNEKKLKHMYERWYKRK